jgi:hypothetical protein
VRVIIPMKASGFEYLIFVRFNVLHFLEDPCYFSYYSCDPITCRWVPVFRKHICPLCCGNEPSWEGGRLYKKGSYKNRPCIVIVRRPR